MPHCSTGLWGTDSDLHGEVIEPRKAKGLQGVGGGFLAGALHYQARAAGQLRWGDAEKGQRQSTPPRPRLSLLLGPRPAESRALGEKGTTASLCSHLHWQRRVEEGIGPVAGDRWLDLGRGLLLAAPERASAFAA